MYALKNISPFNWKHHQKKKKYSDTVTLQAIIIIIIIISNEYYLTFKTANYVIQISDINICDKHTYHRC